ncbi:hypothetical protein [Burkholderia sp. Bp8986]|uniref:hypothetical protein n=1 Tax=Burkholderia sp. Bp8986 TaxID=2184550 RepID=UPI0021AB3CFC|nr:hypothetical protein [Burkholderia sp. Bp8986]
MTIVTSLAELIITQPFSGTSTRDIASCAGMASRSSRRHHAQPITSVPATPALPSTKVLRVNMRWPPTCVDRVTAPPANHATRLRHSMFRTQSDISLQLQSPILVTDLGNREPECEVRLKQALKTRPAATGSTCVGFPDAKRIEPAASNAPPPEAVDARR